MSKQDKPKQDKPKASKPKQAKPKQNKPKPAAKPTAKATLHPRNRHSGRYDIDRLIAANPELKAFVVPNPKGDRTVDFFNPDAVLALNKALLMEHYGISKWSMPKGYLCPPVPGRADYIHHMADVLAEFNGGKIPKGPLVRCLDIGVGASCIYPIIGRYEYGWTFVCSDIDDKALTSAKRIVASNEDLQGTVHCRLQTRPEDILHGVLRRGEKVDLVICNPPFHASAEEAQAGSLRKLRNLKGKKVDAPVLNFGGQSNELWTEGGERKFIKRLIEESKRFSDAVFCFSTLVSKESNLKPIEMALKKAKVKNHRVIHMGQGNKVSRMVTWTFKTADEKPHWVVEERHTPMF